MSERWVYRFDQVDEAQSTVDGDWEAVRGLLGGKGANLGVMTTELGLPVPPGFVISTEACRAYLDGGWPEGLDAEIREHMARIETAVGRRFGGPGEPLLVSVRSGAPISMLRISRSMPKSGLEGFGNLSVDIN